MKASYEAAALGRQAGSNCGLTAAQPQKRSSFAKFFLFLLTTLFLGAAFAACESTSDSLGTSNSESNASRNSGGGSGTPFQNDLVLITGATVKESIGKVAFEKAEKTPVNVASFYIGASELTYRDWYEVRTWAESSGYTFANKGKEGSEGKEGAAPAGSAQPVCDISYRDAVVWCNAASVRAGLNPVYLTSETSERDRTPVKEAEGRSVTTGGKADNAYVDKTANGYRLPTEAEWEFAARGGDPNAEAWNWKYAGTNENKSLKEEYAWYGSNSAVIPYGNMTHDVKTRKSNTGGLYDMCGNVGEYQYSESSSTNISYRGGHYNGSVGTLNLNTSSGLFTSPGSKNLYAGFRVAKNAN